MDTRRFARDTVLAVLLLASGAGCANGGDTRQCLRIATRLIGAPAPAAPPATSITIGVRG